MFVFFYGRYISRLMILTPRELLISVTVHASPEIRMQALLFVFVYNSCYCTYYCIEAKALLVR